jgi:hypothetical protein
VTLLRERSLLRTYGRYFAEFLNEDSSDHLSLLDSPTCVGLRYGSCILIIGPFLVTVAPTSNISIAQSKLNNASDQAYIQEFWNINQMSIDFPFRVRLRID